MNKNIEVFFVEKLLRNKKEWQLSYSYNPTKMQISNHLTELSKSTELYLTKYDQRFCSEVILMQELKIHL